MNHPTGPQRQAHSLNDSIRTYIDTLRDRDATIERQARRIANLEDQIRARRSLAAEE